MPRFVILYHQMPAGDERGSHWDFMLESGQALRTWALDVEPSVGRPLAAQPLADHRLAYLDYEGPISGNRGSVTRWDQGTYTVVEETATRLAVTLSGGRLQGRIALEF